MQLTINLTEQETEAYRKCYRALLQDPTGTVQKFETQWLRVVGEVGDRASEEIPKTWLLADEFDELSKGDRDADNLALASKASSRYGFSRPWDSINLDRGYWVFDKELANKLLAAGIKSYGIEFVDQLNIEQIDCELQELLLGKVIHY